MLLSYKARLIRDYNKLHNYVTTNLDRSMCNWFVM